MASSDPKTEGTPDASSAQDSASFTLIPVAVPERPFLPLTKDAKRLYWSLNGPLNTPLHVMP